MARRLAPNGEKADLKELEVTPEGNEDWVRYELSDGTIIRAKSILSNIQKAVDQNGDTILDDDGEPYYMMSFDSAVDIVELGDTD